MYFIGDEEIEALKKLFAKKKLYRYNAEQNSECDMFESEFSAFVGTRHSLLLSSGTNALVASMIGAGIQPGDEVLLPTYTFVATASAVVQVGAVPVLVNINENLSLDVTDAKSKISPKTKAIILVHMDGLAADVASALQLTKEHNLILIEDAAQAIGGTFENRALGTFGMFGCFSLNESKNISCGEGGILVTSESAPFEKAFCYHDTPAQFSPSRKNFFKNGSAFLGGSMRVSEIQGAIMRVQLTRLNRILAALRERKNIFTKTLSSSTQARLVSGYCKDGDCASSFHLQFDDPAKFANLVPALREKRLYFAPVTARPAHASWKWGHLLNTGYDNSLYLASIDVLMRTVKMEIDIELSLEETRTQAQNLLKVLN